VIGAGAIYGADLAPDNLGPTFYELPIVPTKGRRQLDNVYLGDEPGEMGAGLELLPVSRDVQRVVLAWTYGFALLATNQWVSFGSNLYGAQGVGRTTYKTDASIRDKGKRPDIVVGMFPQELGDNLPVVNVGATIVDVHVGIEDFLFRSDVKAEYEFWLEMGRTQRTYFRAIRPDTGVIGVKAVGLNWYGALGLGISADTFGESASHVGAGMPWVDLCWPKDDVVDVAAGNRHACFLSRPGNVKCVGKSDLLGISSSKNWGGALNTVGCFLPKVNVGFPAVAMVASIDSTCVLTSTSRVK
jgi:hypothetical protein